MVRALKTFFPQATVLAACFALAGCGGLGDTGADIFPEGFDPDNVEAAQGDWLITRLPSEMEHLNPYTATDAYATQVQSYVFEGLMERDPETLEMKPLLAESYEISDDHLTYTFTLRDDVHFSDGEPVTVDDVLFSFNTVLDPQVNAPHARNYLQDIETVEAVDDRTVQFEVSQPYYRHLVMIGSLYIIPEHIYGEGDFNNHPNNREPVGSGPYAFERWQTNQEVRIVRNENYWGEEPYIDRRVFRIITEDNAAFQVLRREDMDVMNLTPELWQNQANRPDFEARFQKLPHSEPRYSYIGWNLRRPQFDDRRVRQALTMLLNREEILEEIYYGLGQVTSGTFFIENPEYNQDIEPWPYDRERAEELLEEAGWTDSTGDGVRDRDGEPFEFTLLIVADSDTAEQIATIFQQSLRRAGITMNIRRLEWATLLEEIDSRNFDAITMGWNMPPDPDPYQVWHSSQIDQGSNYVGFANDEADEIIEEGRREFDPDRRVELYHRFHEIVHEEQPYTFMFIPETLMTVHKRVFGITMYPYGPYPLEWFVPEELHRYD